MFFVVEVMSNGDNKIFYKKMAPIEIRGLLASINKQQKTKNMPFEALSRDKSWIEVELKAFLSDCIKQKSFASKTPFSIEDIKNVHDYQWEFSFQGKKDNLLKDFLGGFKSFLYLKTKEGVEIPIGNGLMNIVLPELTINKEENVYIGKDIVATNYILTYTKESVSYRLESLFLLKSEQRAPSTKRISTLEILANTTDEQIKAYEVYKQLIEYGSMKFGDTEITINASNKKVLLSTINKQLSNLNIHKAVLDILNIKTPINYKTFTGKDNFSMRQLYKALIEHKAIGLTNPQNMFKISIANINVLLVCQSDNREKFYIDNAFTSSIEVIQNNDVTPFRVPIFSFLEQKGYVLFDNIPYDRIVEVYNECYIKDSRVLIQANLDLLHMLKAYDELKMSDNLEKSKFTIEVAQSLAQWLLKHERDNSMIAIHQLNILQIIKRQRTFTKNEVNLLLQLSQNNSDMVKAGAFLLLDKLDVAQFVIQQFPEDMKARFMDFPIAIFVKAPNCCNN